MKVFLAVLVIALIVLAVLVIYRKYHRSESGPADLRNMGPTVQIRKKIAQTPAKAFKKEMRQLNSQTERMQNKLESLDRSLKNYFGDSVISYQKFAGTIQTVEKVFADNSEKILQRIDIFDEEGYNDLFRRHEEYTDAIQPYQAHFAYIQKRLQENEEILTRMDRLLLEVNHLNESSTPIDQLPAMQEISDLIEQTKLYQQN